MMEENSRAKRRKPRQLLYDDEEFTELLEMMRGSRAYSRVRHDKHLTTAKNPAKNPGEHALTYESGLCVTLENQCESELINGSDLKKAFLKAMNPSNGCASLALETF